MSEPAPELVRERTVVVVGGGAAGMFAAIACAEAAPRVSVVVLEKGPQFLSKVRISGGGRCNVTHACFDARELSNFYPRGSRELIGPFQRFQPRDTVVWFTGRGVSLKTERDGRMFPITDSSQTIIDCLMKAAAVAGVELRPNTELESLRCGSDGGFDLGLANGTTLVADRVLLAAGGCRSVGAGRWAAGFGHTIIPPVPSLFTFHIEAPWVRELAGVTVPTAAVAVPGTRLTSNGPVLFTHWGLSGPAILKLSAWGARILAEREYRFELLVDWLPATAADLLSRQMDGLRESAGARLVARSPVPGVPSRLWEQLVRQAGVDAGVRWSALSRPSQRQLESWVKGTRLAVAGKSLNKEEFVTCGGVALKEVSFKTMESRLQPGLYFAGEHLDIDGVTGGFNFQAAWTTGWIAGRAMADSLA